MEFIIGVGSAIVAKLAEYTVVLARRLCHYTSDVDNLRAQVQRLNDARQNLQVRVDEASGKGEDIHDEVQNWLTSAPGISQGAEDFLNNNRDRANISCCSVQIPNLVSRKKLSREARKMVENLQREIQAAQRFDAVASRPALQTVIAMRRDYEDFGSRKTILEDIMKALKDPNVSRIGIYGIGGIGKTTLAKEVARQAVEAKLFTEVAMTTVSRTPDFSGMQREIAEKIRVNFEGRETIPARADLLQRKLKEEKSILIILDDIWEKLDLIEVGIHVENEGCKMLMTSRDRRVLGVMGTNQNVLVDNLRDNEAINLFKKIVGDIVEKSDFMRLAIDVVRECRCLPLAITTVAYALKSQDELSVWKDALMQLQNSAPTKIDKTLQNFYPSLRLSYEFLRSDEEKSLLLLCSLYGEDRNIRVEDLMMCSVGLDLFPDVHTLAHVRIRVESLIVRLKACCLLLDGDRGGDWVKMHDVIRDVALSIASEEGGMHSVVIKKKEDCRSLKMKKLKDSKVLSLLPHSDFYQLPERLECSKLELFLLLSDQGICIPIPNHLLDESKDRLKSLFFEQANLLSVPPSFHSLQNLQTLRLRGCVLEDVNFIGDLKHLQILDLSESTIKQLPRKVGQLNRLQLLNLEGCKDLKLIEPNVISSLIKLEELYISEYFDKWEVGEVNVSRRSNVNLAEIENLEKLTSLSLRVPDAKTFPKDFKFSEKLERYRISIGDSPYYSHPSGISRSLLLKLRERSQLTALGLESLMRRSEWLLLDGLIDVKNVVCDLDSEGFCDLKRLDLLSSDGVQYIVDCVDQQIHPHKAFPVLESLRLMRLRNLERICHGKLPQDSFKNLREVRVSRCDKLKNVFPLSIFKRLHSIQVNNCKMMEEIVGHVRSEDDGAVQFLELRSLDLGNLPKMVKFMSLSEAEAAGGSSSVESSDPFFGEKVVLPSLEDLTLYKLGVKKLWADQLASTSYMPNLSSLYIRNCDNLNYVSSFATAKSCLIKLKKLEVHTCSVLEEVLAITDLQGENGSLEKISLPQLKYLVLSDLPNLKRFCNNPDEFKMLESNSRSTKTTVGTAEPKEVEFSAKESLFNELVVLPSLEDLYLNKLVVKKLWADQIPATSYMQNLSSLDVINCHNLKYVSSFVAAKSFFIKLKKLQVESCNVLKEILIIMDLQGQDDRSLEKISLPQLESLKLDDLPNLKTFCKYPDEFKMLVTSIGEGSKHEKMEFGTEEPFFNEMVVLSSLEDLTLRKLGVKKLWADQLPSTSYIQNLRSMDVKDCDNLKYMSSFAVAKNFLIKLKKLQVERWIVLEEVLVITDLQGQDDRSLEKISLPQLKYLRLYDLPNLKRFCKNPDEFKMLESNSTSTKITVDKDEPEEVEFNAKESLFNELLEFSGLERLDLYGLNTVESVWQLQTTCYPVNLTSLHVGNCNSLKFLFSLAMAERLVKLKNLRVYDCKLMEDIVVTKKLGEEGRSGIKILFPQLEYLTLSKLSSLRKFCHGKVILPKLESLRTDWSEAITEMLATSQPSSMLYLCHRQLKELELDFRNQDKPFALSICKLLHRCHNLEKLQLNGLLVNVICKDRQNEVGAAAQEYDGRLITCLRELRLDNVPKLRHLFGEFVSIWQNLTILEVSFCHRLTYLLASSTATSLVQLKEMRVTDCNRMTEIITDYREGEITEGEHDREFVFLQLEILVLHYLPNLGSFFSGNNVMRFPKLKKLFVSQCPEMRTFSHGIIISSSMLNTIIPEIDSERIQYWSTNYLMNHAKAVREHWDGDVNTTLRQLWEDDSNLALQQLLSEADVHASGEGTSSQATRL